MMDIKIRAIAENTVSSTLIRWWTWDLWSHVELVLPEGYLGARAGGVSIRPVGYCKVKREMIGVIEVPDDVGAKILEFAYSQIGKRYDFLAILGFILHKTIADKNKWICSEFIVAAFLAGGIELLDNTPENRISPRDIVMSPLVKWKLTECHRKYGTF